MDPQEISEEEKETHLKFMREAIGMAELALRTDETPVGCVFVHNGVIIGRGMNATNRSYNGTRHAEFLAINDILTTPAAPAPGESLEGEKDQSSGKASEGKVGGAGRKYSPEILKECDLYVTIEPCIMCASLLRQFGVRKVYFGGSNEKFGGTGGVLNVHRSNGAMEEELGEEEREERKKDDYEVSGGWLREEAIVMLRRFYVQENGRAPEPRNKKERVLKLEVEPIVMANAGKG